MSDEKKPYTNLDLESAEQALIRAGSPEIAPAMRQYTEGIRNYVQGEFGQSFIKAVDSISEKHTVRILSEVAATMQQMLQEKADADTIILAGVNNNLTLYNLTLEQVLVVSRSTETQLGEVQRLAVETARRLGKFQEELEGLRQGQIEYNARLDAVITRLDTDEERLDRKRERLDTLESQVRELRGPEMPPGQRQRYINILMQMIAEWERTHPDSVDSG